MITNSKDGQRYFNALMVNEMALRRNIKTLIEHFREVEVIGVCKGNGYGLGLIPFANALIEHGVTTLAVASTQEGIALRESGIEAPILMLSSTSIEHEIKLLLVNKITPTVGSFSSLAIVKKLADELDAKLDIQLVFDTGFGRFGFMEHEMNELIRNLKADKLVNIVGLFSHFSEGYGDEKTVRAQLLKFTNIRDEFRKVKISFGKAHMANSSAAIKHDFTKLNAVRLGSAFVGRLSVPTTLNIVKIGEFASTVTEIHDLKVGDTCGYSSTFTAKRDTKIAVVSAGTSHGLNLTRVSRPTAFKTKLYFIRQHIRQILREEPLMCKVWGRDVPCVGVIGVTNAMVDVTDTNCHVGDICTFDVNPLMVDSSIVRIYES